MSWNEVDIKERLNQSVHERGPKRHHCSSLLLRRRTPARSWESPRGSTTNSPKGLIDLFLVLLSQDSRSLVEETERRRSFVYRVPKSHSLLLIRVALKVVVYRESSVSVCSLFRSLDLSKSWLFSCWTPLQIVLLSTLYIPLLARISNNRPHLSSPHTLPAALPLGSYSTRSRLLYVSQRL